MEVNDLLIKIKEDLKKENSYDRYPVRFFGVRYHCNAAKDLMVLVEKIDNLALFNIRDLLPYEDAWITEDRILSAVKGLDNRKSYILVGFSEYARFLSEEQFISLVLSLLEIENADTKKRRIYIPCFALFNNVIKTVYEYHRRINDYNPLLNEEKIADLPNMFFLGDNIECTWDENKIDNSSEWFDLWKNEDIKEENAIVCTSKCLPFFYKKASPNNVYNINYLVTYQDVLREYYKIKNFTPYMHNPDNFFKKLIEIIAESNRSDIKTIIANRIHSQIIDGTNFYSLWKSRSDLFDRWLIQNFILQNNSNSSYLYRVVSRLEKLSDSELIHYTYTEIFSMEKNEQLFQERKQLLESYYRLTGDIQLQEDTKNELLNNVVGLFTQEISFDDGSCDACSSEFISHIQSEVLPYLTSYSLFERELIIWLVMHKCVSQNQLIDIYPSLFHYISDHEYSGEFQTINNVQTYLQNYKKSRLNIAEAEEYKVLLSQWNRDENEFYKWYFDAKILFPETFISKKSFFGNVYVLDGVGAEFTELIVYLLKAKGISISEVDYGKSHLPTTTEMAKNHFSDKYIWKNYFDNEVIHGAFYKPISTMERSISAIEKIVAEIINIEGDNPFAIIADHGATVGYKLSKTIKKYSYSDAEHDGRCMLIKKPLEINKSEDYLIYENENHEKWLISLNDNSLNNMPKYVAHGGATPEEIFVPMIIAQNQGGISEGYSVLPKKMAVSGLDKTIEISIQPKPSHGDVKLQLTDGSLMNMRFSENKQSWFVELPRGIAQTINIFIEDKKYTFKTTSQVNMEDDLFDD